MLDGLNLFIKQTVMNDTKLSHWDNMHQLSERCTRDIIIVNIKFRNPSVLDDLDKLFCTNILNQVVLELQFLDSWTLLD